MVKLNYEIRPRKDRRGVDLICDSLPHGKLRYGPPNAVENAASYAHFNAGAQAASITIFDEAGEVIESSHHEPDHQPAANRLGRI
jgi:hypothetical protein